MTEAQTAWVKVLTTMRDLEPNRREAMKLFSDEVGKAIHTVGYQRIQRVNDLSNPLPDAEVKRIRKEFETAYQGGH